MVSDHLTILASFASATFNLQTVKPHGKKRGHWSGWRRVIEEKDPYNCVLCVQLIQPGIQAGLPVQLVYTAWISSFIGLFTLLGTAESMFLALPEIRKPYTSLIGLTGKNGKGWYHTLRQRVLRDRGQAGALSTLRRECK